MDYWDEVMQDDVYLVATEGWAEAARPRVLVPVRGKAAAETPDLTVKRKKYRMDLLPPGLVVGRYFAAARAEIDRLRTGEEEIAREREEFIEENSGEDGLLDGGTSDTGKVTQAAVNARLKEVRGDPAASEETRRVGRLPRAHEGPHRREESDEDGTGEAGRDSARSVRDADRRGGRRDRGRRQVDGERPGRDRQRGRTPGERTGGSGQGAGRAVCGRVAGAGASGGGLQREGGEPPEADGAAGVSEAFDFERLVELCRRTHEETRRSAARAVDRSLVVRNWLFGWYIVEFEQSGADRAEYGRQTLKKLSAASENEDWARVLLAIP